MSAERELLDTPRFRIVEIDEPRRDGTTGVRAVIRHAGAVVIVPMVDDDHVCLIRNLRHSVGQTLLEVPAGTLEAGEPPETTARRELTEETGYTAATWRKLTEFYASPGILDERMFLYLASDLTAGSAALEPDEFIENILVPWRQAIEMCINGEIEDAKSLAALLLVDHLRRGEA
ncbi:MAG: NUDIX hydrolase [Pirellulaceae bacterium]|nr:NUDIX hydrolase [Pirellulaceae bacterium]MDP7018378.1 NUDIX hydrolase [Pirellulaceae bacterium]